MSELTSSQKLTAFGLLGTISLAFLLNGYIDKNIVIPASIMYGMASAGSAGYYRLCELLKNGRAENNDAGKGTIAGVTIFCSLLGINSMPHIYSLLTGPSFKMMPNTVIFTGLTFGILGFLQNRNTFLHFLDERPIRSHIQVANAPPYNNQQ